MEIIGKIRKRFLKKNRNNETLGVSKYRGKLDKNKFLKRFLTFLIRILKGSNILSRSVFAGK